MKTKLAGMLVILTAAVGCGGGASSQSGAGQSGPASTVAAGDFGVPECDQYIKKTLACVDTKVPEAGRAMMRQQLEKNKAIWKQAASTPQGKSALATGCTQADAAAKAAMTAYGCQW